MGALLSAVVFCLVGGLIVYSVLKSPWALVWRILAGIFGLLLFLFGLGVVLSYPLLRNLPPVDPVEHPVIEDALQQAYTAWAQEDWPKLYDMLWPPARDVAPPAVELTQQWEKEHKRLFPEGKVPAKLTSLEVLHAPTYQAMLVFQLVSPDKNQLQALWKLATQAGVALVRYTAGPYTFELILVKVGPEWHPIASPAALALSKNGEPLLQQLFEEKSDGSTPENPPLKFFPKPLGGH